MPGEDGSNHDDPAFRQLLARGYEVRRATSGSGALGLVRSGRFDVLLSDWRVPDMTAVDLLERLREVDASLPAIFLTENGDIEAAVSCLKYGAYDYVARPYPIQTLRSTVDHALEKKRLRDQLRDHRKGNGVRDSFGLLIGRCDAMQAVFRRIAKIAPHHTNVLVLGESGTGKEMVAREIQRRSPMAGGPFVAVNCGGVPGDLIESELFGHERGAFTGATHARDGLFVAAAGGTLFLDEIGAMPMPQQASLLRVLERKEVRRVGSTQTVSVDTRVVAATNIDLEQAMEAGTFRQDLYYRISSMIINLPPMRDRVEDIPLLCTHFLALLSREHDRPPRRFSPQALDMLCNRRWPGNVRELQHVVDQAFLFSRDEVIRPGDLPFPAGGQGETKPLTLREVEREHIRNILARTAGNKVKAALLLGIPRPTLYHRMQKLGLEGTPSRRTRSPRK